MPVILTNFFVAQDVRIFNPAEGTLQPSEEHTWEDSDGRFAYQDEGLFCLYCDDGKVWLHIDGTSAVVDDDLKTTICFDDGDATFRLIIGGATVVEKTYPQKPESDWNPFWTSSPEDEDILLWIHNIVESRERQLILLSSSKGARARRAR